jgi:FkbM family methyltransferase
MPKELRAIAYKRLRLMGMAPDIAFETDFFGLEYSGHLSNNIEYNIYRYGAFEKPLLFFLQDTMRKLQSSAPSESIFYDIGANIGQHSLFMSRITNEVHSFEPYSVVSCKLEEHISKNQIKNITLHKVGLSKEDELMEFFAPTGHNQGIGSFDTSTIEKGNIPSGKLNLVNGDSYIEKLKLPSIGIMKMDVEGFEKNALLGLHQTLKKDRPIIVCEISYGNELSFASHQEFKETIPNDYKFFSFDTRKTDGTKAKKRGRTARYTGEYRLIPHNCWQKNSQEDIICCPSEKLNCLKT